MLVKNASSETTQRNPDQSLLRTNTSILKRRSTLKGPIKILIIESQADYCRAVWCAIGLGFAQVLIGATVMVILLYTIASKDEHAILCGLAYHFFSAEAILCLNYANSWSTSLRLRHRRLMHGFLQCCGTICALTGTILILLNKGLTNKAHGITGLITVVMSVISLITGPLALFGTHYLKIVHMSFGIPTFLMSSISLCFGLFTTAFKSWAEALLIYLLVGFVVYYTTFIVISSLMKCIMRI